MQSGITDYLNNGLILEEIYQNPDQVWTRDEIIGRVLTETKVDPLLTDASFDDGGVIAADHGFWV